MRLARLTDGWRRLVDGGMNTHQPFRRLIYSLLVERKARGWLTRQHRGVRDYSTRKALTAAVPSVGNASLRTGRSSPSLF